MIKSLKLNYGVYGVKSMINPLFVAMIYSDSVNAFSLDNLFYLLGLIRKD